MNCLNMFYHVVGLEIKGLRKHFQGKKIYNNQLQLGIVTIVAIWDRLQISSFTMISG